MPWKVVPLRVVLCAVRVGPDKWQNFNLAAFGHLTVHELREENAKCKAEPVLAFFPPTRGRTGLRRQPYGRRRRRSRTKSSSGFMGCSSCLKRRK
jgi:hypothetical protein